MHWLKTELKAKNVTACISSFFFSFNFGNLIVFIEFRLYPEIPIKLAVPFPELVKLLQCVDFNANAWSNADFRVTSARK